MCIYIYYILICMYNMCLRSYEHVRIHDSAFKQITTSTPYPTLRPNIGSSNLGRVGSAAQAVACKPAAVLAPPAGVLGHLG